MGRLKIAGRGTGENLVIFKRLKIPTHKKVDIHTAHINLTKLSKQR